MLLSIIAWLAIAFAIFMLLVLIVPFRIRINGVADHAEGIGYALTLDWALGLIAVEKCQSTPFQLNLLGLRMFRFSPGKKPDRKKKEKSGKKKTSSGKILGVIKTYHRTIGHILGKMIRSAFLRGRIAGRIGLADPAHTANISMLYQFIGIPLHGRLSSQLIWVYDEEVIHLDSEVQATLIFGYLALTAGMLLLERQTRLVLHTLRHA